jgi:hypothetical protein
MNIKEIFYTCFLTVGLFLNSLVTAQSQPVGAAPRQAEGTDFILLIDESGSMCGSSVHVGQSDPSNKRNEFIKLILMDLLKSQDMGLRHRLSVIEFGARDGTAPQWRVQVTLSAFPFPAREMDEDNENYFNRVFPRLKYLTEDRNRGNTDHGEALRLALAEMQKLDQTPVPIPLGQAGVEQRLKVVVLITDGKPFLPNMTEVQQLSEIDALVRQFPHEKIILFVLGLNADTDYWYGGGFGEFWRNVALKTSDDRNKKGDALYIKDHKEIYKTAEPMLRNYIYYNENNGDCCGDKYDCPPYLKSVEFTIEYSSSYMNIQESIRIIDPNGDTVPYHYFNTDKTFAKLKVDYPMPGTWKFEIDKNNPCKVICKEEAGTALYVGPLPPFPVNTSEKIRFRLEGKDERQIIETQKHFPLEGVIYLRKPSKEEVPLNANAAGKDPGLFETNGPYTFGEPGIYNVRFIGKTISVGGEPKIVISTPAREVMVVDSHPVTARLQRPVSLASTFGGVEEQAVISFQEQGEKVPVHEILEGRPSLTARLEVHTPAGKIADSRQIPLQYREGVLTGPIDFDISWRNLPEFLRGDIEAKLTLEMDNKLLKKKYFLKDPGTASRLYEFPIPVSASIGSYLIIALLVLVPCTLAAYFTFFRKRAESMSKDIPVLIYRHGNKFDPDLNVTKPLEILKHKMVFNKKVKTPFDIPKVPDQWEPLLTVIRHMVPRGVKVSIIYEKYKSNPIDKKRFQEVQLATLDNNDPAQHKIVGLEPYEMIFELKIKEEDSVPSK